MLDEVWKMGINILVVAYYKISREVEDHLSEGTVKIKVIE